MSKKRVLEKETQAFDQFKTDVKNALKSLDCWGDEKEVKLFIEILQRYRKGIGLNPEMCAHERPHRKVICQLPKGHKKSHQAVIFWEDE